MSESRTSSKFPAVLGWFLIAVGVAVFAIRLNQAGPYFIPRGGNFAGGAGCLLLGIALVGGWLARPLRWVAFAVVPLVLYLGLYATLAELEEVVVLEAADVAGRATPLRLWIVDDQGTAWVSMNRSKAEKHGLDDRRAQLLRDGAWQCVHVTRFDDPAESQRVYDLRHAKYAVQRNAAALGLYPDGPGPDTVVLRLDICADG